MPESKLREKWMYYDWSRVDRCSPLSVRLSLFVQAEISSLSHSTQGSLPPHTHPPAPDLDEEICFSSSRVCHSFFSSFMHA